MSIIDTYNFIKTAKQMAKAEKSARDAAAIDNKVKYPRPGSEYLPLPAYTMTITHYYTKNEKPTIVRCYLPEELTLDFSSEYSTPFAELGGTLAAFNSASRVFGGKLGANILSMHVWDGSSPLEVTVPVRLVAFSSIETEVLEKIRRLTAMVVPEADTPNASSGQLAAVGFIKSPGPRIKFKIPDGSTVSGVENAVKTTGSGIVDATKKAIANPSGSAFVDLLGGYVRAAGNGINEALKSIEIENKVSIRFGSFCFIDSAVIKRVSSAYDLKLGENEQPIEATVDLTFSGFLNPLSSDIPNLIGGGIVTNAGSSSPPNYPAPKVSTGAAVNKPTVPVGLPLNVKPPSQPLDFNPQHIKTNSNGEVVA
jgi:hypothetical protein